MLEFLTLFQLWSVSLLPWSFFKYNCQPKGYISEGERAIDIQSEQAATIHMITIRVNSATILQRLDATDTEWAQE